MSISRLAPKTFNSNSLIHISINRHNNLQCYLFYLESVTGPIDSTHTTQAQERLYTITTSNNRIWQHTLTIWFDALQRPRWIISITSRIGTTRHSSPL